MATQKKIERRVAAEARQQDRDIRSAEAQLRELDKRLGEGVGAVKERERLEKQVK